VVRPPRPRPAALVTKSRPGGGTVPWFPAIAPRAATIGPAGHPRFVSTRFVSTWVTPAWVTPAWVVAPWIVAPWIVAPWIVAPWVVAPWVGGAGIPRPARRRRPRAGYGPGAARTAAAWSDGAARSCRAARLARPAPSRARVAPFHGV
jgi:hypothetical protein